LSCRPLPFDHPERLVQKGARKENSQGNRDSVSRTQEKKENAPRTCARAR
jgi:hypothetical protein